MKPALLIAIACILTGCGYKIQPHAGYIPVSEDNITTLNGCYCNTPLTQSFKTETLWQLLNLPNDSALKGSKTCLSFQNNKLSALLYNNGSLVDSIQLKGKIKKGYFISTRRKIRGVPFIVFSTSTNILQLGKDTTNHLLTDIQRSNGGHILILSAGSTNNTTYQYPHCQ